MKTSCGKFLNLAHYFPYDVKLRLLAHSRSFLGNQKARNAIVGAENLLNFIIRIDQCHKNATYYWPLDKAVGNVLLDVQGRSHGKRNETMTEGGAWVSGPTWHSVTSAALNLFESG